MAAVPASPDRGASTAAQAPGAAGTGGGAEWTPIPVRCRLEGKDVALTEAHAALRTAIDGARHVVFLTGAGISAESGIPTFRGPGGLWRRWNVQDVATPAVFRRDPSRMWEFYSYRRDVVARCKPNAAHYAVAALQRRFATEGRRVSVVTQNIDRLHQDAGTIHPVIEMHGSLWLVKRHDEESTVEKPGVVWEDRRQPLCPGLDGAGSPDPDATPADIPVRELPRADDGKLLRPAVVWFGEGLDPSVMGATRDAVSDCDVLIVVGTSSVVYPAASLAPAAAAAGKTVVEVNLDPTPNTSVAKISFQGKAGQVLPYLLGVVDDVRAAMEATTDDKASTRDKDSTGAGGAAARGDSGRAAADSEVDAHDAGRAPTPTPTSAASVTRPQAGAGAAGAGSAAS